MDRLDGRERYYGGGRWIDRLCQGKEEWIERERDCRAREEWMSPSPSKGFPLTLVFPVAEGQEQINSHRFHENNPQAHHGE